MIIVNLTDRDLTEEETDDINRHAYYRNSEWPFAYLGNGTVIEPPTSDERYDADTVLNAARLAAEEIFTTPPDFSSYVMDDGYGLVLMQSVSAITPRKLTEEEANSGRLPLQLALATRERCFEACRTPEFIAIALPEA